MIVEFNGSAGYGDPLARDPQRVADDVRDGKVGAASAQRHYGVVLAGDCTVDTAATESRRATIRTERLDGAAAFEEERLGTVASDEVLLRGAAGGVDVAEHDGARVWACSTCGELLGPATESFKRRARYRQRPPQTVDERLYPDPTEFSATQLLLRQYACPGCATLLAQEFCLADDEPWQDFQIEAKAGPAMSGGYSVGVDIGGTFTDCAVIGPDGSIRTGKVPTRPTDRALSFFEAIEEAASRFGLSLDELLGQAERDRARHDDRHERAHHARGRAGRARHDERPRRRDRRHEGRGAPGRPRRRPPARHAAHRQARAARRRGRWSPRSPSASTSRARSSSGSTRRRPRRRWRGSPAAVPRRSR